MRFIILTLAGIFTFTLAGCGGGSGGGRLGEDAIKGIAIAETNAGVLKEWTERKVKADLLIHIDVMDDMAVFPPMHETSMKNAAAHLKRGNVEVVDQVAPVIENGGVVNLGYRAGFFKKVIWVVPLGKPVGSMNIDGFKRYLVQKRKYKQEHIDNLAVSGPYIEGTIDGIPLTITRLEDLDVGESSALLDIDLAYFQGMKAQILSYQPGTKNLLKFIQLLSERKIDTRLVSINMSTLNGAAPIDIRFFGRLIEEAVSSPGMLGGRTPEKWSLMMEAEDSLVAGSYGAAERIYTRLVEEYPGKPGLHFSLAVVRGFMEKGMESREAALEALRLEGVYIRAFFQLAMVLAVNGRVDTGVEIIETPELTNILSPVELNHQKGIFFLNGGRPFDAVTYLKKVADMQPKNFTLHTALYRAYSEAGLRERSTMILEKMRRIDEWRMKREMPWAFKQLGINYEKATIYKNALEAYEIYISIAPPDSVSGEMLEKIARWREMYNKHP